MLKKIHGFRVMPKKELLNFLEGRGEKVYEFSNPWHGIFEIYRINWNDDTSKSNEYYLPLTIRTIPIQYISGNLLYEF